MSENNKSPIRVYKTIKAKNAIFITAWPGMGNVSLKVVTYLKEKLKPELFAEFKPEEFFYHSDIWIEDTIVKMPQFPKGEFYYWKDTLGKHDIILFISEAQPPSEKAYAYANQILSFIESFNVKLVYTFAAMPMPIEHTQISHVWLAVTHKKLIESLRMSNIKLMKVGQISGLNGLFLGVAKERGLSGICLLGEIPLYTVQIENPKASLAILEALVRFLEIKIDLSGLSLSAKLMEEEIEKLIEYIKKPFDEQPKPISEEEIEKIRNMLSSQSKLPDSIKKKIEELFAISQKDIAKASQLKEELDKWKVYRDYEDRFLDLFRKSEKKDN